MAKHGQIPWRISISSQNLDHGHHTPSHASVDETTLDSSECGGGGGGITPHRSSTPWWLTVAPVVSFCHRKLACGLRPSHTVCPPSYVSVRITTKWPQWHSVFFLYVPFSFAQHPCFPALSRDSSCFFYCCMSQKHHTSGCIPRFWPNPSLVLDRHTIHLGTGPFLTQPSLLRVWL